MYYPDPSSGIIGSILLVAILMFFVGLAVGTMPDANGQKKEPFDFYDFFISSTILFKEGFIVILLFIAIRAFYWTNS